MSDNKPDLSKVQGYIPAVWKEHIKTLSKETGQSESAQVKMALELYLKSKGLIK